MSENCVDLTVFYIEKFKSSLDCVKFRNSDWDSERRVFIAQMKLKTEAILCP
jgi:hypothetical protein